MFGRPPGYLGLGPSVTDCPVRDLVGYRGQSVRDAFDYYDCSASMNVSGVPQSAIHGYPWCLFSTGKDD